MPLTDVPVRLTPDDLLAPQYKLHELVNGRPVEKQMTLTSSKIALRIGLLLTMFLDESGLGEAFGPDASFRCFPDDADKIRRPDVSVILAGRLGRKLPDGHCPIAPDLAVEVISPTDSAAELEDKVADYIFAGVRLVWVVNPSTRTVRIHRPTGAAAGLISRLSASDTISGEDVLPGFAAQVSRFFAAV